MINNDFRNETWRIDFWQLISLNAVLVLGVIIPFSSLGKEIGRNIWLAELVSLIMGLVFCFLISILMGKYRGKNLTKINVAVFGQKLGKVVNIVYLLQAMMMFIFILVSIIDFWQIFGMEKESYWVYAVIIIIIALFATRLGIEAIGRIAILVVFLLLLIFIFDLMLVLPQLDPDRLLPIGQVGRNTLVLISIKLFILQFSLLPLTLMLAPYLNNEGKKVKAGLFAAWGLTGAYIILSTLRNVSLLGDGIALYHYPIVQALRMVEWGPVFSRFEFLGIIIIMANALIFLMLANSIICIMAQEIINAKDYRTIIIPLAILSILILFIVNKFEHIYETSLWFIILGGIFLLVLLFLLLATIKSKKKENIYPSMEKKEEKYF